MAAIEPALIEKLQKLPPQRLAEVKDFVEFLAGDKLPFPLRPGWSTTVATKLLSLPCAL